MSVTQETRQRQNPAVVVPCVTNPGSHPWWKTRAFGVLCAAAVVALVIAAVWLSPQESPEKQVLFHGHDLVPLINKYLNTSERLRCATEPTVSGVMAAKRNLSEFAGLFADTCVVAVTENATTRLFDPAQFASRIRKAAFMKSAKIWLIGEPEYQIGPSEAQIRYVQYLHAASSRTIVCRLRVAIIDGEPEIVEVTEKWLVPTESESDAAALMASQRPYSPKHGLGARYLGGGRFAGTGPSYSPDGTRIAFASLRHESSEIYVLDLTDMSEKRLTHTPYWEMYPQFSADGRSILAFSDETHDIGGTLTIRLEDGVRSRFINNSQPCGVITRTNDGSFTAAVCENENRTTSIWIKEKTEASFRQVTFADTVCVLPRFQLESATLLFAMRGLDRIPGKVVGEYDLTSGVLGRITVKHPVSYLVGRTTWHDYDAIVYLGFRSDYSEALWSYQPDVKLETPLITQGHLSGDSLVLSNDGKTVFFAWDGPSGSFKYDIYRLDLNKTAAPPTQLTKEGGYISGINVSPNGEDIVFLLENEGARRRGKGLICVVPSTGGAVRRLCANY